jgi:DNA (cytosine-5)-methyltransferase 3A
MRVLSLFDGMSCGRIALDRAGIAVEKYYASEIDKYAIKVSTANYPDIEQLGDVRSIVGVPDIDLLIGGSPCQGFSFAGKQLNFDDPRSKLFFEFVRILKTAKPKYFLLENVKMKKEYQDVISEVLGVDPIEINSSLVSAQNRRRLFWTNIKGITQPKDKGILLRDILEDSGTGAIKTHGHYTPKAEKSQCLDANYFKGVDNHGQRTMIMVGHADNIKGHDSIKRVYSQDGKAPCLTTMGGGHREPKVSVLRTGIIKNGGQGDRIYSGHGKGITLSSQSGETAGVGNMLIGDAKEYRKLTPLECERLQTVPDNYTNHVSNTQRYKMLGNGWTVDVIAHILSFMEV